MEKNYKFFQNVKCEYFPCHHINDTKHFNCLFCYCPLYILGDKCGGNPTYLSNGVKDCSQCITPHLSDNYDYIIKKLTAVRDLMKNINDW